MTHFKTILMTAALMAVPSAVFAQDAADMATEAAKEKAVDSVMDNMTGEDAVVAGKTMIQGGSKEDAAIAVVKNRADAKIEDITGGVSVDEYSKDGVMDAGKELAQDKMMQKAQGSATTYENKGSATTYTDGVTAADVSAAGGLEADKAMALEQARAKAKAMSIEKAKMNGETWGMSERDKAKKMITSGHHSGEAHVIQKGGASTMSAPTPITTTTSTSAAFGAEVSTLNCPSGTKDAGDGTCMITGDWEP